MKVTSQLFIGTTTSDETSGAGFELLVDGEALIEEVKVELSGNWPDYVFEDSYSLTPIPELEKQIEDLTRSIESL